MKRYSILVDHCGACPACSYIHYDGEGESCQYFYTSANCLLMQRPLPNDLMLRDDERKIVYRKHKFYPLGALVPVRKIPDWCPLKDDK